MELRNGQKMKTIPTDSTVNVPAFLSKLWWMVNDRDTDKLISWSSNGNSFIIQNQAQFWYELLPVYYKHNNMSSFVRQLNMYGFHKISTVENGAMDSEKDEIQFFHPCFQKEKPDLLQLIKRKVTATKGSGNTQMENVIKPDDLSKVLSDVKNLRGKQANVDSQLTAMKQENAVLWRELAMLRQKHMKQQQIVNKLIQFLVTIVQPNPRMSGLGVKRHYPLMLSECPEAKKEKKTSSEGPTIHELDNSDTVPEELFEEKRELHQSDVEHPQSNPLVDELLSDTELAPDAASEEVAHSSKSGESMDPLDNLDDEMYSNNEKIFLNAAAPDALLSNLINGSYNSDLLKDNNSKSTRREGSGDLNDLAVARVEYSRMNSNSQDNTGCRDELDSHLETTQSEIDQLKDILHGCNTLDANALLGLFSEDTLMYGLACNQNPDEVASKSDPLVSGSELATYTTGLDFSQLFDDTSDPQDVPSESNVKDDSSSSINTPQISNIAPLFPSVKGSLNKENN